MKINPDVLGGVFILVLGWVVAQSFFRDVDKEELKKIKPKKQHEKYPKSPFSPY